MRRRLLIISFIFVISSALPLLAQSESHVLQDILYSDALGSMKSFQIYLPEGYDESNESYPVVYFLHPKDFDWFKPYLNGHGSKSLKHIADSLTENGIIGKTILVSPDLGDCATAIPGMPNMLRPDLTNRDGIGSGKFENYLVNDLIPYVDSRYRTMADRSRRGIDGFELGGYAAVLTALKHPQLFNSVGSYDAPFMWYNFNDQLSEGIMDDTYWLSADIFSPTFDNPRNTDYMLQYNVMNLLMDADDKSLETIQSIRFHIHANNPSNLDFYEMFKSGGISGRNVRFMDALTSKGISNSFSDLILISGTISSFSSALQHASQSLIQHWISFAETATSLTGKSQFPETVSLSQNYPNPFNPSTTIPYTLKDISQVKIDVLNVLGQTVSTLVNETQMAGRYQVVFDASDLPSGVYFCRLEAGHYSKMQKMILVK